MGVFSFQNEIERKNLRDNVCKQMLSAKEDSKQNFIAPDSKDSVGYEDNYNNNFDLSQV